MIMVDCLRGTLSRANDVVTVTCIHPRFIGVDICTNRPCDPPNRMDPWWSFTSDDIEQGHLRFESAPGERRATRVLGRSNVKPLPLP